MERQRAAIDIRLGERIRELRVLNGYRQRDLASFLGISHQQVQKYESGRDKISLERLARLKALFGVSWNALLEEDPCKATPRTTKHHRMALALLAAFGEISSAATKRHLVDLVELIGDDRRR